MVNGGYLELKSLNQFLLLHQDITQTGQQKSSLLVSKMFNKWVTNAISPEILFDNCTEDSIKGNLFADLGNSGW